MTAVTSGFVFLLACAVFALMIGTVLASLALSLWAEHKPPAESLPKRTPGLAKAAVDLADLEIAFAQMTTGDFDAAVRDLIRSLSH